MPKNFVFLATIAMVTESWHILMQSTELTDLRNISKFQPIQVTRARDMNY